MYPKYLKKFQINSDKNIDIKKHGEFVLLILEKIIHEGIDNTKVEDILKYIISVHKKYTLGMADIKVNGNGFSLFFYKDT